MARMSNYVAAPRIEVVLVPSTTQAAQENYELWLILRVPDGKEPTTVRLGAGPYDRDAAVKAMLEVYTTIGEFHAFGDAPHSGNA